MNYRIGNGHRLQTSIGAEHYVLEAGALIPAALVAAWIAVGSLAKILAAGVVVEDAGEALPASESSPASRRRASSTRSALGYNTRRALG